MESELGISAASIYRILTENLGYIKVCAKFVPHTLKPHEKNLRIFDYLTKNRIVTINHSPDMAPCDFYLFEKLHLAMKGKLYDDVDAIQKASTAILKAIPKDDLKSHSIIFLILQIVVFSAKGTISKATNKMFAKENQFLFYLIGSCSYYFRHIILTGAYFQGKFYFWKKTV